MNKTINIEGMSCNHCVIRVEKALNSIDGVDAKVDLKKANATVNLSKEVPDTVLKEAIENAGYTVKSIK